MEISKEQIAKMAESYKKAETQHVAQRAVTRTAFWNRRKAWRCSSA